MGGQWQSPALKQFFGPGLGFAPRDDFFFAAPNLEQAFQGLAVGIAVRVFWGQAMRIACILQSLETPKPYLGPKSIPFG